MTALNTHDSLNYGIQVAQNNAPITANLGSSETQQQACLRALRITDPRSDKNRIEETNGGLLKESYRWILENDQFGEWKQSQTNCLLWVKGDPGKGKTMLVCGIIDELTRSNGIDSNISFFFCQATNERINNATAVLRGLIFLLVDQSPSLLSHVQTQYDKAGKALFEDANAWSALSIIFKHILRDPSLKSTYLIIDALDECISGHRFLLDMIVQESSAHPQIKWLISSRNWPSIEERLNIARCLTRISLELNDSCVSEAVKRFVQHKVTLLANAKGYLHRTREIIYHHLVSNSQDTFLWVALVCQNLDRTPSRHAIKRLDAFPPGLSSLYDRMTSQLYQSEDSTLCKQILAIVSTVHRPITLDELNTLIEEPHDDGLSEIIAECGSFLTLQKRVDASDHNTVTFVHQSAKDFLLTASPGSINRIFPGGIAAENHRIFEQSLELMFKVLRRDIFGIERPGFPIHLVEPPSPNPLAMAQYACLFWVDHLSDSLLERTERNAGSRLSTEVERCLDVFLQRKYLNWLEALSLSGKVSSGILAMQRLDIIIKEKGSSQALSDRTRDALRFVQSFRAPIESSPLQVYYSPLIFSPTRSLTKISFKDERPGWILNDPLVDQDWGQCIQILEGHTGTQEVTSIAWSPDGSKLASAASDDTVRIWNSVTGQAIHVLEESGAFGTSVAWSPDGNLLASIFRNTSIRIWDIATLRTVQILKGHIKHVESIAWSPDGSKLVSTSADKTIRVWDPTTGQNILNSKKDTTAQIVVWSPDGSKLALGYNDSTILIWNFITFQNMQILRGHNRWITSIAWSPNGRQLASVSDDGRMTVWNCDNGRNVWTRQIQAPHGGLHSSISWSPDGDKLASGSSGYGTIEILDSFTGQSLHVLGSYRGSTYPCTWSPDGYRLASGARRGMIRIWDLATPQSLLTPKTSFHEISTILWSPNRNQLASSSLDGTFKIWDAVTGQCIRTLGGHGRIRRIAWSPDGRFASSSDDKTIRIWDLIATGQRTQVIEGHSGGINSIAWSPDGSRLASASDDETVRIWSSVAIGESVRILKGHTGEIELIAWSKDGSRLASVSHFDKTIRTWNLATGQNVCVFQMNEMASTVTWSSDGTRLATACLNSSKVMIWDTATEECVSVLHAPSSRFLEFDNIQGNHLHTSVGTYDIQDSTYLSFPRQIGYGFNHDGSWITYDGENVLWLPAEYRQEWHRPCRFVTAAGYVAIGGSSDRVVFLEVADFNMEQRPFWATVLN